MAKNLIENVYVINLERCKDRKEHIIKEFKKNGLTKYEFFKAVDKDDKQVKDMMKTDYVKKFPPCFRCAKFVCNCSNNFLIPQQIGNWCSFINLMKHIVEKKYTKLVMICEDDIKFTKFGVGIIARMINTQSFKKYNINMNKPILIRLGSALNNMHQLNKNVRMIKKIIMSNPAFIINRSFAESFLKNLIKINTTSDVYLHKQLINRDKNIQHYTLSSLPIYELSFSKNVSIFQSEIHPKGINNKDRVRAKNHIKKLIYKKILCIGHPRTGTNTITDYMNQLGYNIRHEKMGIDGCSSWMLAVNDNDYPWGNVKNINQYHFDKIVHIVRNPFDAIPSIILENKYGGNQKSYNFRKRNIKKYLNIDLPNGKNIKNNIETAIQTYIYWSKICELKKPDVVCKIENTDTLKAINPSNKKIIIKRKNKTKNKLYMGKKLNKPIITKDMYKNVKPELLKELEDFCKKYNYDYILDKI